MNRSSDTPELPGDEGGWRESFAGLIGARRVGTADFGTHPRQQLDVYRPASGSRLPVIVFFYGGRWKQGSRRQYGLLARRLAALGAVVVVPDYRLYPLVRFPVFVEDGAAAVDWTLRHAAALGGDPARVYLMGHSAGAHIGALMALDGRYLAAHGRTPAELAGFVGLAGPYDFMPFQSDELADTFGPAERHEASQPIHFVDGRNPPFLLLHGSRDRVVGPGNSKRLWRRIEASGGRARMVFLERADHFNILLAAAFPFRSALAAVRREIGAFVVTGGAQRLPDPPTDFMSLG